LNLAPDKLQFAIKIEQEKAAVRRSKLAELESLHPEVRRRLSTQMLAVLQASPQWQESRLALLFHPLRSEPDLAPLLEGDDRSLILPRVTAGGLDLHFFRPGEGTLRRSRHGMFEPDPHTCARAPIEEIDLALIPGLAFDPDTGIRLGRGGGYYDRLLADKRFRAVTIGIAFGFQLHAGLPAELHDQPVASILTESCLTPTRAASARTRGSA
jgi:5-formyltetrahydrofolate cyclo-ligase